MQKNVISLYTATQLYYYIQALTRPLSQVFTYPIHLCIRCTFPPFFVSKSWYMLYMLLDFVQVCINAFKSREIDPKRRYFQHWYDLKTVEEV